MTVGEEVPRPRLCHLIQRNDFNGYGFNLHAEKNKPGIQYIGMVDSSSPAEAAGLREGDKIIEVNGVNISHENHKQVVERIRSDPNQTKLLVVDSNTEKYHKDRNIIITGELEYVHYICSENDNIDTNTEEDTDYREDSPVSDSSPSVRQDSRVRKDSVNSDRTLSNRSSVSSRQEVNANDAMNQESMEGEILLKSETAEVIETITPTPQIRVEHQDDLREEQESSDDEDKTSVSISEERKFESGEEIVAATRGTAGEIEQSDDFVPERENFNNPVIEEEEDYISTSSSSSSSSDESEVENKDDIIHPLQRVEDERAASSVRDEIVEEETEHDDVHEREDYHKEDIPVEAKEDSESSSSESEKEDIEPYANPPAYTPVPEEGGSISSVSPRSTPSPSATSGAESVANTRLKPIDGLNLPLTAREMREMLSSRKKRDPRKDGGMDFRRKFDIIQAL